MRNGVEVVHAVDDIDPGEHAKTELVCAAFDWTQAAPQNVCFKASAERNISAMLVTRDTSQLERSTLNLKAR